MESTTHALKPIAKETRSPGFFKRLLYWIMDWDDEAAIEEGRRRLRSAPGFFESLPPGTLEYLRNYDGPENHGPPLTPRERRDLEKRRASLN